MIGDWANKMMEVGVESLATSLMDPTSLVSGNIRNVIHARDITHFKNELIIFITYQLFIVLGYGMKREMTSLISFLLYRKEWF